ncbi:hypothetical protein N2E09_01790 [Leuconostoc citreum]
MYESFYEYAWDKYKKEIIAHGLDKYLSFSQYLQAEVINDRLIDIKNAIDNAQTPIYGVQEAIDNLTL